MAEGESRGRRGTGPSAGVQPLAAACPIQYVGAQGMAFGEVGVVEIIGWVVGEPDALHHPLGPNIQDRRDRHDLIDAETVKGALEHRYGGFRCEAVAPETPGKSPTDLELVSEWQRRKAREPCEVTLNFERVEPKTVAFKGSFNPIDECIGRRPIRGGRKERHHFGIGIHGGERTTVARKPSPEYQAFRDDLWTHSLLDDLGAEL